jgi:hypothetical protein
MQYCHFSLTFSYWLVGDGQLDMVENTNKNIRVTCYETTFILTLCIRNTNQRCKLSGKRVPFWPDRAGKERKFTGWTFKKIHSFCCLFLSKNVSWVLLSSIWNIMLLIYLYKISQNCRKWMSLFSIEWILVVIMEASAWNKAFFSKGREIKECLKIKHFDRSLVIVLSILVFFFFFCSTFLSCASC